MSFMAIRILHVVHNMGIYFLVIKKKTASERFVHDSMSGENSTSNCLSISKGKVHESVIFCTLLFSLVEHLARYSSLVLFLYVFIFYYSLSIFACKSLMELIFTIIISIDWLEMIFY